MHEIEIEIMKNHASKIKLWFRYIDDIFFVTTLSFEHLLQISNSIHTKIKFTLEKPVDNTIPFLDLSIGKIHNSFQYSMYVKDCHSNTCLPFNSFVPNSRKINLIYSETRRAINRSSNAVGRGKKS